MSGRGACGQWFWDFKKKSDKAQTILHSWHEELLGISAILTGHFSHLPFTLCKETFICIIHCFKISGEDSQAPQTCHRAQECCLATAQKNEKAQDCLS